LAGVAAVAVTLAFGCAKKPASPKVQHVAHQGDVAIVGGTVLPMDKEGALAGHTVLVRGDRIVAVAPDAAFDVKAARVIDARGRWVLPGLADMHVHFWGKEDLDLFLLNGVTTVRNLFGSPEHVRWRDAIVKGELDGPTVLTAGPIIDGDPPVWPGSAIVTTAEAGRATVRDQKAAGYDWLKVYNGLSVEAYDAILDEAKLVGMPVAGHVPKAVGVEKVIASGQRTIEHLDGYVPFFGEPPTGDVIGPTAKAGVWNCPTLVVTDNFGKMDKPEQLAQTRGLDLVSAMVRDQWDPKKDFRLQKFTPEMFESVRQKNVKRRALVSALHEAGAKLVLGTDTGNPYVVPGFAVVEELRLLVQSGLTPWQALRMATAAAGELQGQAATLGVLAAGARADVIVVGKDPLADVTNVADPSIVVVRGKVFEREALVAAAKKPPPSPSALLAEMPALATEGTAPVRARYDVYLSDQLIGAERMIISKLDGDALVVNGQGLYVAPSSSSMTYRSTRDALDLTTDALSPPHVVVTRKGATVSGVQDGKPALEREAAADAVLAPQAIAEFVWYAAATAKLKQGESMPLTAVEVLAERSLSLDPGTFTATRIADKDGRRTYDFVGKNGKLDLKGGFSVDADGAPHEVTLTLVFGTFVMRRSGGDNEP
ncbi:MAG TPA: amidohydrolase family protein, partial [Kofleriaceae bacterium]|nr:amidohydrolase family protein [Kofleriaceae bacterium]